MSKKFPQLINFKNDYINNREMKYIKQRVKSVGEIGNPNFSLGGYMRRTLKLKNMKKIYSRLETINKVVKRDG